MRGDESWNGTRTAVFSRILVAADDSAMAARGAEVGTELAHSLGAALGFVWVVDPAVANFPDSGVPEAEFLASAEREAKTTLAAFRRCVSPDAEAFEFVTTGKAATEIVNTATAWQADLIVIGSHRRSGIERLLEGSVAEDVIHRTRCAVLVVGGSE